MAGLLDSIFNSPEGRMGLGLLALGQMPKSQGFGGLMGLLASQDAAAKAKADGEWQGEARGRQRKEWTQADAAAEAAARQKAAEQQYFFGGGGLLGAGAVGGTSEPAVQGAGVIPAGGAAVGAQGGKIDEWAQQLGIPRDAIIADYMKNGGKGIADMIMKRGTPDMQVSNGYAYDKNKLGAGFMPSLSTSQDGKTSMVRIGQDGLPVVSSPQGALDTYNSYQGAQAAFKPIKVYNPATGREEFTNERAVVQQPQHSGGGYAGGSAGAAAPEQIRIIQTELNRLPADHPDRPALMREIQRIGGQAAPSGNYAAGPSAFEAAQNEAARVKLVEQAKADVVPTLQRENKAAAANDMLGVIEMLDKHPGRETATGASGAIDPRNYIPGTDAKDFSVALDQLKGKTFLQAFESLKGGGQITEVEGKKATEAIGRLNTAQSDKAFKQALGDLRGVVEAAMKRTIGEGGASGGWDEKPIPAAAVNDLKMRGPKAHAQFDAVFGEGAAARALGGK
ncbi:MAG: hypothetical protein KBF63_13315 [Rhodoferax sp.]|nr:hypothetical protein [Rhodoferax sp.]